MVYKKEYHVLFILMPSTNIPRFLNGLIYSVCKVIYIEDNFQKWL